MKPTETGSNNSTKDLLVELIRPLLKDAIEEAARQLNDRQTEEDICGIEYPMQLLGKTRSYIYSRTCKAATNPIPHWRHGQKLYFSKAAIREWLKNGGK